MLDGNSGTGTTSLFIQSPPLRSILPPSYLSLILRFFFYPSFVTLSIVHLSLRSTIIKLQLTHYTDKQIIQRHLVPASEISL